MRMSKDLRSKVLAWLTAKKRTNADVRALASFAGIPSGTGALPPEDVHVMTVAYVLAQAAFAHKCENSLSLALDQWVQLEGL